MPVPTALPLPEQQETANDRWKRGAQWRSSRSMLLAVAIHVGVFALWPQMSAATSNSEDEDLTVVALPEVDIPPAPEQIARPAQPVIGDIALDESITVEPTDVQWHRPLDIAPPPVQSTRSDSSYTAFVPTMLAPRLLNPQEVERAMRDHYPVLLRNAGVGGRVEMHLWVDEHGTITRSEIAQSSGYAELDEAALRVVRVMRMSPASNRGRAVRVIVSLPVLFNVR